MIENISTDKFAMSGAIFGLGDSIGMIAIWQLIPENRRRANLDAEINTDYELMKYVLDHSHELDHNYQLDHRYELNHRHRVGGYYEANYKKWGDV